MSITKIGTATQTVTGDSTASNSGTLLVNNGGIAVFAPLLETSDADWRRILEVNLTGPFLCTKAAALQSRRGLPQTYGAVRTCRCEHLSAR